MNELKVTTAAVERIKAQLAIRGRGLGLRLGVKDSGCSGFAYVLDYADEQRGDDRVLDQDGVKLFVDEGSWPMLRGVTLDYRREGLNAMFKFDNPNATDLCGCGESFAIASPSGQA